MSGRYKYRTRLGMSPEKAEEIRREYFSGKHVSQSELGRRYGMAQQSISRIVCGYYWNYKGINFR
jgi:transcriptional regulator with XRE-family HTH domain